MRFEIRNLNGLIRIVRREQIDEWSMMIDMNSRGILYGIAADLPAMREHKSGHIINLSSIAGHNVYPDSTVYCAIRHAVKADEYEIYGGVGEKNRPMI
ncbi:SDR family NAD(P)-dependent oxidoreductase [Paenibacillus sp. EKM202P]|uniref:SDR family oxidoreductase n=1 Tax=unclassified Paenibacillus TaxID=185978 RepID=UPI0013EAA44F|nr:MULTISPECIES: SDR family NAD(P)-dependent oxidoreductase [unclassified Paenibacillus]KAF6565074.1 SDR family NAD(P)-dependent oxidoreductase [Paenibacillus sp. EKM202P]KAF6568165.1 SDR family NAD(P)-dependent oxidoreductase [Paenibacillus sp. EKM207P]